MNVMIQIAVVVAVGTSAPRLARADHHDMVMSSDGDHENSSFDAGVSLVAARFDSTYYAGDYQGVVPTLGWSRGQFAVTAMIGLYRLAENGLSLYGQGDAMVQGVVRVLDTEKCHVQVALGVSAPTADVTNGLGMGHTMMMPSTGGGCSVGKVALNATVGYARALADLEDHVHGMWPLVEPMNMSEITWGGGATYSVRRDIRVGARIGGGVPIVAPGIDRVIGALRVDWTNAGVTTGAELQVGVVGDPFVARGVVETAVHF